MASSAWEQFAVDSQRECWAGEQVSGGEEHIGAGSGEAAAARGFSFSHTDNLKAIKSLRQPKTKLAIHFYITLVFQEIILLK